jgi:hypothetical protein
MAVGVFTAKLTVLEVAEEVVTQEALELITTYMEWLPVVILLEV